MANPQPDEFTRISNELLDALCKTRLSGESRQILDVIFRKTYGYRKKKDSISLTQFSELTNIPLKNCPRAIKKLKNLNMIIINKNGYISEYSIQKDYEKWGNQTKQIFNLEALKKEDDTFNLEALKIESDTFNLEDETTFNLEDNKRKKETYKRKGQESVVAKEKNSLTILNIWIRSFGRNPKPLENETTEKIIKKFGAEKTLKIFQTAVRKNFYSVFTLFDNLTENGNIKGKNHATTKASVKSRTDYRYDQTKAEQRLKELEEMDSQ